MLVIHLLSAAVAITNPPPEDPFIGIRGRFETAAEACTVLSAELAPPRWAGEIAKWCHHRTYHATRGKRIVSRVDQSWTHDVDRPKAWRFVKNAYRVGAMTSDCQYHRVRNVPHPEGCKHLARKWPWAWAPLSAGDIHQWLKHTHGVEKYGTRGPHDNTAAYGYVVMKKRGYATCWPSWWMDDPGVSVAITIWKSLDRCERSGNLTGFQRCTFKTIQRTW